jgi:hypothetical protein
MVTWDVAGLEQNDAFLISAQTDAGEVDVIEAEASPATIPVTPGEETCVVVTLLRDGVPSAESAPPACAGPT